MKKAPAPRQRGQRLDRDLDSNYSTTSSVVKPKNTSAKSQREAILAHLQKHGWMTTLDAREQLGIMAPSSRISELKDLGHNIDSLREHRIDIAGIRHRQALYVLLPGMDTEDEE